MQRILFLIITVGFLGCGQESKDEADTNSPDAGTTDILEEDTAPTPSCDDEPCMHLGTCTDIDGGVSCECAPGYDGPLCENNIDDCVENPCVHGQCFDEVNAYLCDCDPGYQGETCDEEVENCDDLLCVHGICTQEDGAFVCICHAGFEGGACEDEINECIEVICENEGTCVDGIPTPEATACLSGQDVGGCDPYPICADAVCAMDPYCCDEVWDATCANCAQAGIGYDGLDCAAVENACTGAPGFSCDCPVGIFGTFCEYELGDCLDASCLYGDDYAALTNGVVDIDSGFSIPSALVVYGETAFPVVVDEIGSVIVAAGPVAQGRMVAFGHESHLLGGVKNGSGLRQLALNAIHWTSNSEAPVVGVTEDFPGMITLLEEEGIAAKFVTLDALEGVDVIVAHASLERTELEIATVKAFAENGGGILLAGQAWWWSYSNSDVAENYPGNQLITASGIRWSSSGDTQAEIDLVTPEPPSVLHHARYALPQYLLGKLGAIELTEQEITVGNNTFSLALTTLPLDYASYYVHALEYAEQVGPIIPTGSDPVYPATEPWDAAEVRIRHRIAADSPPELLEAHPASLDYPGPIGEGGATVTTTMTLNATYEGIHKKYAYANPQAKGRRSTGLYAPPGELVQVTIPQEAVDQGLDILIGCHSDTVWHKDAWKRFPQITRSFSLDAPSVLVANAFGGLVYLRVPIGVDLGDISVTFTGAVPAPRYIHGETTLEDWQNTLRYLPGPWTELETDKIIITIPSTLGVTVEDPVSIMDFWNAVLDADATLSNFDTDRPRAERITTDRQISAGSGHSGYPLMAMLDWGPQMMGLDAIYESGAWGPFHELGHNHQWIDWVLPGTTETTVNLFSVYAAEEVAGVPREIAHPALEAQARIDRTQAYIDGGSNFAEWSVWLALESYLQIQESFGWAPFQQLFYDYRQIPANEAPMSDQTRIDAWVVRLSEAVNYNLAPFYTAWGVPLSDTTWTETIELPVWFDDPMRSWVVYPAVVETQNASNVSSDEATVSFTLSDPGSEKAQIDVYWGVADGGNDSNAWDLTEWVGEYAVGTYSHTLTGLSPGTEYFYTFTGTNLSGTHWSVDGGSFSTP